MNSLSTRMVGRLVGLTLVAAVGATATRSAQAALPPLPNTVQQWNKIAEDTVVGSGAFQGEGEVYMSYVATAVYDAVVAIEGGFEPYGPPINAPAGASLDCAVVEAAYRTLRHYFSSIPALVASLDGYYSEALSPSNLDGCTADAGKGTSVGLAAANSIIDLRTGRRAPDADWDNVVVRDEESRSGRVATHSAVCASANAVAGVGATVPAEEPGTVSTRTSDPAAE